MKSIVYLNCCHGTARFIRSVCLYCVLWTAGTPVCFNRVSLFRRFDLDDMIRFTLTVRKNYRNVPYHNWAHAFSVAHAMFTVIKTSEHRFTPIEVRSLDIRWASIWQNVPYLVDIFDNMDGFEISDFILFLIIIYCINIDFIIIEDSMW